MATPPAPPAGSGTPNPTSADVLATGLAGVRTRLRIARVVKLAPYSTFAAAAACAVVAGVRWVRRDADASETLTVIAGVTLVAIVAPALRRASNERAARLADTSHGLDSRLENAVHLVTREVIGPFERAAIDDAVARLPIDAERAVPVRIPRIAFVAILTLVAAVSLGFVPLPAIRPVAVVAPRLASVELDADTIAATRAELAPLRRDASSPDVERTLTELDELLDDLAAGRIPREEAFRRLDAITRAMATAGRDTPSNAEQSLATLGRALGTRSEALDPVAEALRNADAAQAAAAMRELASQLRAGAIDRAEIQRIREAFERMEAQRDERDSHERELERRRDELRSLLEREREAAEPTEPSLLERRQRELERLERELAEIEQQRRELERLERELEEAAEDLERQNPSDAAQDLDQAFEDLNRMARERSTAEQRESLARQIEQLREALRRQQSESGGGEQSRQSGGSGSSPMRRFVLRAGGEGARIVGPSGAPGQPGGNAPGEGMPGDGSSPGEGQGAGQPGAGQGQPGGSGAGQGQGQGGDTVLMLQPGGQGADAILELPGQGGSRGSGEGRGNGGAGERPGEAGTGHDPQTLDAPTDLDSSGEMSRVDGADGEGATRSQVIRGASASGFAGRGYRNVHADYASHAEEILEREDVPPGYRYYVHRYFQLIRPREGSTP